MSNVPPPPPPPPPPGFGEQPGPYGAPGYGAPGYGAPGYGYGYPTNQREHPDATTVLVLGILGLVICQLLSPIAWAKGSSARKQMDAQPHVVWTNRGNITAGWICGIIGTAMLLLGLGFIAFAVAVATGTG